MNAINKSKLRTVLRWPAVLKSSGYSTTQLREKIKQGKFPLPFQLSEGGRAVGFWEDEVVEHQRQRDAQRITAAEERSQAGREQYQTVRKAREERKALARAGEPPLPTRAQQRRERRRQRKAERIKAAQERAK